MLVLVAGLLFLSPSAGTWGRDDDRPKGWEFVGRTQAAATVEVRARVAGQLTQVAVKEGDAVKKGDLLAEVDPRQYRLALDGARARLKAAEAKLKAARIRAANAKKLKDDKVVSTGEADLYAAAEAEAEATLLAEKVEVQRGELTLSWARVVAPFDGLVARVQAAEGGLVAADRTSILTVVDAHQLRVSFDVPEATLLRLRRDGLAEPAKLGVAVGFSGEEGHPHEAKLDLIAPEVDPKTGAARFRATLANPKGLFSPGMSARVRLTPRPK